MQPLLRDLPWGLVKTDSEVVVEVGRTDRRGKFHAVVAPGKYRVRYVTETETPLDREIMNRLQPVRLPPVRFREIRLPLSRTMGFDSIGFHSKEDSGLSKDEIWGLSRDGQDVVIDCPMKNSENLAFVYGVALVLYGEDNGVLTKALIPVSANQKLERFQGSLRVTELSSDPMECEPGDLYCVEKLTAEIIAEHITVAMVDAVLDTLYVKDLPDLNQRIMQLKKTLQATRGHHE